MNRNLLRVIFGWATTILGLSLLYTKVKYGPGSEQIKLLAFICGPMLILVSFVCIRKPNFVAEKYIKHVENQNISQEEKEKKIKKQLQGVKLIGFMILIGYVWFIFNLLAGFYND